MSLKSGFSVTFCIILIDQYYLQKKSFIWEDTLRDSTLIIRYQGIKSEGESAYLFTTHIHMLEKGGYNTQRILSRQQVVCYCTHDVIPCPGLLPFPAWKYVPAQACTCSLSSSIFGLPLLYQRYLIIVEAHLNYLFFVLFYIIIFMVSLPF